VMKAKQEAFAELYFGGVPICPIFSFYCKFFMFVCVCTSTRERERERERERDERIERNLSMDHTAY